MAKQKAKKLVGFQIFTREGEWHEDCGFASFEILSYEAAKKWLETNDGDWLLLPIFEGDVEEPSFVEEL